jgi:hypothetical protein
LPWIFFDVSIGDNRHHSTEVGNKNQGTGGASERERERERERVERELEIEMCRHEHTQRMDRRDDTKIKRRGAVGLLSFWLLRS